MYTYLYSLNMIEGDTMNADSNWKLFLFSDKRRCWTVQKLIFSPPLCLSIEKEGCGGEWDNLIASCTVLCVDSITKERREKLCGDMSCCCRIQTILYYIYYWSNQLVCNFKWFRVLDEMQINKKKSGDIGHWSLWLEIVSWALRTLLFAC